MNTATDTNSVERSIVINAPRERVWLALSDAEKFGTWFGANLKGQTFESGKRVRGPMASANCGHDKAYFDAVLERIEPQDVLAYSWHPYAVDPAIDYAQEESTLVTFTLSDAPGNGTLLTVLETGFDKVPPHRRQEAYRMHSGGWEAQLKNVMRYVTT